MSMPQRVLSFLTYLYLLRFPLLSAAGIVGFCVAAFFWPSGAKLLLGNAFDISSRWGIFFVSLAAFLSGWVVVVTGRLILLYGPKRFFDKASLNISPNSSVLDFVWYALIALPVIVGMTYKSTAFSLLWELSEALLGLVAALVCLIVVVWLQLWLTRPAYAREPKDHPTSIDDIVHKSPDLFLPTEAWLIQHLFNFARSRNPAGGIPEKTMNLLTRILPPNAGRGYVERDNEDKVISILPGHVAAPALLSVTLVIYAVIGWLEFSRLGQRPLVPTLCYLLLLAMLLCWGFSGLAFFLDRYRIPVIVPLVVWLAIASCSGSDYVYQVIPSAQSDGSTPANPTTGTDSPSGDSIIVVAANGGGIQAAAWTARVLTGLEEECQATQGCDDHFGRSIQLISSVSGGSVGNMYFVNEYTEGGLPQDTEELEQIVERAEGSSLDQIAWGLLYPDLVHTFNPFPYSPGPLGWDRGRALEQAWLREDMPWATRHGIKEGLTEWQEDTREGRRPAVIFNTTVAETGYRLPLATTELPKESQGRISYDQLFKGVAKPDVPVVTAARLSAAFPYISPAARANVSEEQDHLVDGGYYDNYGISSLVEWLNAELDKKQEIKRVLILEIRGAPSGAPSTDPPGSNSEGNWFSQVAAPPLTVLNVRGAGQRTHNEVELNFLADKWAENSGHPVEITRVDFEYSGADPPLSWHLTEKDKRAIEADWEAQLTENSNHCMGWEKVKYFLMRLEQNC